MDSRVCIRTAGPADAIGLARLKEAWADLPSPATDAERTEFAGSLARWMQERGDSVICQVAELEGALIGMAWLIVFERVPDIRNRQRRTGDIQSVFVQPSHRARGIGSQLIRTLTVVADDLGIPRVTVSANSQALAIYQALGFVETPFLLERRARAMSSR
ncbi:GNAT family N-acetyltransferase [Agromyces albus]|uniref:GNAT family N-acetyltransferase n=1 Tax=Agromyces albus TaxID=205332 RepID=UPI002782114E|nr:GNAT family N-acetyltransferase [Agromyces albus]MDQ0577623.1 GNAT superfamily N-acetyltransferase [Agromyces albus]